MTSEALEILSKTELLVIIPTYGHFDYAKRCVESLVRHTPGVIYIAAVIDDASPDWRTVQWDTWPRCYSFSVHFKQHDGLTRSWNEGLRLARKYHIRYTLCGNSDLLFTPGWFQPLKEALTSGYSLVGPMSNNPGHCPWQNVAWQGVEKCSDSEESLTAVASRLHKDERVVVRVNRINGFCMLAETATWWSGAFDAENVFDPKYKLEGNEDELQMRWLAQQRKIGIAPRSYVFHYRSISRPEALIKPESKGAFRPGEGVIR